MTLAAKCPLPEGRVEKDVEDHVGRRVDDEHEVADAGHAARPDGKVSLSMLLENGIIFIEVIIASLHRLHLFT